MNKVIELIFWIYKNFLSNFLFVYFGPGCRHLPSCSIYSKEALEKYGLLKGSFLSLSRVVKCNPFSRSDFFDPLN